MNQTKTLSESQAKALWRKHNAHLYTIMQSSSQGATAKNICNAHMQGFIQALQITGKVEVTR